MPPPSSNCFPSVMLLLALPLLLALVAPLHTRLAKSEPAAGSVVTNAPRELRLWFEGGVEAEFTQVALRAGDGTQLALGAPTRGAEDGLVVVAVPLPLPPDRYTVLWSSVGRDGHTVAGEFGFIVAGTDGALPPPRAPASLDSTAWGAGAPGRAGAGDRVVVGPGTSGTATQSPATYARGSRPVRWLELAALTMALGAVALLLLVLRTAPGGDAHERFIASAVRRVRLLGLLATGVFLAATAGRFVLESRTLHGGTGGITVEELARTAGIGWGRGWTVGTVAMLVLLIALLVRVRPATGGAATSTSRGNDLALALAAVVAAAGPAVTGHAVGSAAMMPLAVLADWLHVIGASAWVGGVASIALGAAPAALAQPAGARAPAMAWLIGAFHALATPALVLVASSGLLSAWLRVGSWQVLTSSNYGELLLFKVYLVAFIAVLGAYHWHRARPRLVTAADDDRAARHLSWTLYVELLVGVVVLALTAALVTTQPPQ